MNFADFKVDLLAKAIALAAEAHLSHLDKGGKPYILHPLRVMFSLSSCSKEEQIVAVLHDVVEDSSWTLEELEEEGFSTSTILALDCLTRRSGEDYAKYILRVSLNPIASRVKLADLRDNVDLGRIAHPTQVDLLRAEKYRKAIELFQEIGIV